MEGSIEQENVLNLSCPPLIILKLAFFRGLRVYELKFCSKKDNEIILFPVKAEMLLFSNLLPRRHPGGFPKLYFDMKF